LIASLPVMGFKYVLVPATNHDPMQELDYGEDIEDLTKDTFREFVEKYFAAKLETVDRDVLLAQLQERTGVDLKEKTASGAIGQQQLDSLLQSTSVEIFPVMLPTKETEFEAISVYCDDKGVAKELDVNSRVSGIVQACGYIGQTFRGDCFIGRVFDDTEDVWKRTDFTLKDCSTDAEWVARTRKQREKRKVGDMEALASQIGAKNPARVIPDMMADAPKGETDKYLWRQEGEDIEITFKKEGLGKADAKNVKVAFGRQHLKVEAKGEVLIDSPLCGITVPDEGTWTLSDGVLEVHLAKQSEEVWDTLVKS